MIVVLKHGVETAKRTQLIDWLKAQGLVIHISEGEYQTVLGLVGDTTNVDMDLIASLGIVDSVKRVSEPFKCCNRKFHPDDTVVDGVPFTASDCCDMLIDGDLTFVGRGIHGDGLYFSNSLSGSKAYGDHTGQTVGAVLNSKARVISETQLRQDYDAFVKSHPQARKALGFAKSHSTHDSYSQFALIRGYNVISSDQYSNETYYTVLDRSALTMTRKRY